MLADNWGFFFIPTGLILLALILAIVLEKNTKNDYILLIKPRVIVIQVALVYVVFYGLLFVITYCLDCFTLQRWSVLSVMHFKEYHFRSVRGTMICVGALLAYAFSGVCNLAIIQTTKMVFDITATVAVLHFAAASVAAGEFIVSLEWWGVFAVGVFLQAQIAELLTHAVETMPFKANFGGNLPAKKQRKATGDKTESDASATTERVSETPAAEPAPTSGAAPARGDAPTVQSLPEGAEIEMQALSEGAVVAEVDATEAVEVAAVEQPSEAQVAPDSVEIQID